MKFVNIFLPTRIKLSLVIVSIIGLIACIVMLIPEVQSNIIYFIQSFIIHRELHHIDKLDNYLVSISFIFVIILYVLFYKNNKIATLCCLFTVFILYVIVYYFWSLGRDMPSELRFPFFGILITGIITYIVDRDYFSPYTALVIALFRKIYDKINNNKVINSSIFVFISCGLIGALFFIYVYGITILDFTYTDWLMNGGGDLPLHYFGWRLFRNSAWYFPIGMMDNIVYPLKESIIYTDSIPLFAVISKLFSPILPHNFQYFGLFGILCYILQGGIGGIIVKKIGGDTIQACIGSFFFTFSTVMLWRMYVQASHAHILHSHTSLAAHFIILLCILVFLSSRTYSKIKRTLVYSGLLCLSAVIHMYFVLMVFIFMCFDLLSDYLHTRNWKKQLLTITISCSALLITMLCFGAFYSHSKSSAGGLGFLSANINALFNPQGTSCFLKDLPLAKAGQYEGYSYLGLGIIVCLIMIFSQIIFNARNTLNLIKYTENKTNIALVVGIILVFTIFALSPAITFNQHVLFTYVLPKAIRNMLATFRSTGRMTWPVIYIITVFCIWYLIAMCSKKAVILLLFFVFVQFLDLRGDFTNKGNGLKQRIEWKTQLPSEEWNKLAKNTKHIFFFSKFTKLYDFLYLAAEHNITVNDSSLARKNESAINEYKQQERKGIQNGEASSDTIYVFAAMEETDVFAGKLSFYLIDGIIIGIKEPAVYLENYQLKI
ncbi:MAG: DUF6311 domain-containing protein [Spirochaetia bacterium]|jgi:hypothetical protein|nr:DUF6311 domain-containing protein [Spirochaetia bacterium]